MLSRYPGVMLAETAETPCCGSSGPALATGGASAGMIRALLVMLPYGINVDHPTAWTPGRLRTRSVTACMRRRPSGWGVLASAKSISVRTTPAGSNPSCSPPALRAPRKKRPALKIRTSARVIWAMTSRCRGAKKRVSRPVAVDSAPWFFSSLTMSVRADFSAGPRLKSSVARRQKPKVTASTTASGRKSAVSEKFIDPSRVVNERSRSVLAQ